ncbi:hypothetical protein EAE96_009219 [Botrytis aclada]|nr:hypothetical protein EAE96_009219 [Botrytis aclada]
MEFRSHSDNAGRMRRCGVDHHWFPEISQTLAQEHFSIQCLVLATLGERSKRGTRWKWVVLWNCERGREGGGEGEGGGEAEGVGEEAVREGEEAVREEEEDFR